LAAVRNETPKRWFGNYQHKTTGGWKDVPKSKKLTFNLTANGITKPFVKKRGESLQHVLVKGILWKLYMDKYPSIQIEETVEDDLYTPDVVAVFQDNYHNNGTNGHQVVTFWGEAGRMSINKALALVERYPDTHLVQMRWAKRLGDFAPLFVEHFQNNLTSDVQRRRRAKFEFAAFADNDVWRLIDANGTILGCRDDFEWLEW
jgi:hypothetical protein